MFRKNAHGYPPPAPPLTHTHTFYLDRSMRRRSKYLLGLLQDFSSVAASNSNSNFNSVIKRKSNGGEREGEVFYLVGAFSANTTVFRGSPAIAGCRAVFRGSQGSSTRETFEDMCNVWSV